MNSGGGVLFFDAHNHLQDDRFGGRQTSLVAACREVGVAGMVVNGSCEEDWPAVLKLARAHPGYVLPSFGVHPWSVTNRTPRWRERLAEYLDAAPCAVGEIGLDRWKPGLSYEGQEEVFLWQFDQAAARDVPVSIHCLRTWGRLLELLRSHRRPQRGFLLHSYGGPREMVEPLAALGAYFSLPGYFAHDSKARQRDAFQAVPTDRFLVETDAPDQRLPEGRRRFVLEDPGTGKPVQHPADLPEVYAFAAELRAMPLEELAASVEANFRRLFGARTQ